MPAQVGNWVRVTTVGAAGTGSATVGAAVAGYAALSTIPDGLVWYTFMDGDNKEAGQGTSSASGTAFARTTISSTLVGGVYDDTSPTAINLSASAELWCTFNKVAFDELVAGSGGGARKNLIMNGDGGIDQRDAAPYSGAGYSLDRWASETASITGITSSTDAPDGFASSIEYVAAGVTSLRQGVELPAQGVGGELYAGRELTLSFWAKASSAVTLIMTGIFTDDVISGANPASQQDYFDAAITTGWVYYTGTITLAADPNGTNTCYALYAGITTAATLNITGIQLELGSSATPFEYRTRGQELALVKRFYTHYPVGSALFFGMARTTSTAFVGLGFPVEMRGTPDLITSGVAADYQIIYGATQTVCTSVPVALGSQGPMALAVLLTGSAVLTVSDSVIGQIIGSGFLGFESEL